MPARRLCVGSDNLIAFCLTYKSNLSYTHTPKKEFLIEYSQSLLIKRNCVVKKSMPD
jgi:hypothetical protein